MTPIDRLTRLKDRILNWSAYKSLKGNDKDSSKLDSIVKELSSIIKIIKENNGKNS